MLETLDRSLAPRRVTLFGVMSWMHMDMGKADLIIRRAGGMVVIEALSPNQKDGNFAFAESDFDEFVAAFEKMGETKFSPASAKGDFIKIDRMSTSKDFGLTFSNKKHLCPHVAIFKEALEAMSMKSDLARDYPEIAKAVEAHVAIDTHAIWALSFKVSSPSTQLLRVRGSIDPYRLDELKKAAGVLPTNRGSIQGDWRVFSEEKPGKFLMVGHHVFDFEDDLGFVRTLVKGFFGATKYYVNGKLIPDYKFAGHSWKTSFGDIIVAVKVESPARELTLDEMPLIKVSKVRNYGPYYSPRFTGYTPLDLSILRSRFTEIFIDAGCEVVCPRCGRFDCNDHPIQFRDPIYVFDPEDSYLFEFQATGTTGSARNALWRFGNAIVGYSSNQWTGDLKRILLNGVNSTVSIWARSLEKNNIVDVLIK